MLDLPNQAEIDTALAERLSARATEFELARFNKYWLSRLILSVLVALSCVAILSEPTSMVGQIVRGSGESGRWVVVLLLGLSCIAIVDVGISDLLPERFTMLWVLKRRHLLYMAMALALIALAMVFAWFAPRSPILWVIYATHAGFCVAIAFLDLFSRPR